MIGNAVASSQSSIFSRILSKFPLENVTYGFAYGSRVLKQVNNQSQKNMIDFIFAVKDAERWHQLNLEMNPNHYSALSFFGSKAIAKVQINIPSRVYFNSMIPIKDENVMIKYGVIEESDLIADLLDWNDIYVAGRLHKPVKVVQATKSQDLTSALQLNLQSAVHTSLLLLPENFSEIEFYKTIVSLSYHGDFRMKIGEDKNKINNIVYGALEHFRDIYLPITKMMEDYVDMPNGSPLTEEKLCSQDIRCENEKQLYFSKYKLIIFYKLKKIPKIPVNNANKCSNQKVFEYIFAY